MFIAQRTQARRAQQEEPAGRRFQPQPAGGENPQEMAAREEQYVPGDRSRTAEDAVGPCAHLVGRFTSRAAVTKQLPIRASRMDLGRAATFILAVVPFEQIAIDAGCGSEAGHFTGPARTLQGAGKNLDEI